MTQTEIDGADSTLRLIAEGDSRATDHVLAQLVGHLLAGREQYNARTRHAARRSVADALACAAAGAGGPTYERIEKAITPLFGGEANSTVWFRGRQGSLAEALYLNSTAVAADDLDDGHRGAIGHPGGAVVPAVLGYAQATGYEGDLLGPIAFGYDVAVTIAKGRAAHRVPTMATGRWAAYGVAAAIWALTGDDSDVLKHALAHAGSLSPQLVHPSAATPDGLKEGTAWATLAGLTAYRLASNGVDAPIHLLNHHPDFDSGWFTSSPTIPSVEGAYFKRYACCRWIHPALDLIYELRANDEMPSPSEIESIEVETFERSLWLPNDPHPSTLESAHYSFPFCVALGILAEHPDFLPLTPATLTRAPVLALAERVKIREAADLTGEFPDRTPIRLSIKTKNGAINRTLPTAVGDPSLPLSDDLLAGKHSVLLSEHEAIRNELRHVLQGDTPLSLADLTATLNVNTERLLNE